MTIEMPESGETADKKQNNLYFVSIFCGGGVDTERDSDCFKSFFSVLLLP